MPFSFRPHHHTVPVCKEQSETQSAKTEKELTPSSEIASIENDLPDQNAQHGLQKIEAVTSVWSTQSLILAYVLIFVIYFINSLQEGITTQLTPYVYSDFSLHSLVPLTTILSGIIGALVKLPVAKVLDVWGRTQGFALMVVCCTLGLIMMAACNNVETYCAAQVFYWIGYDGMLYVLDVFVADTSNLKDRALAYAFVSSPYLATTWAAGPAASSFLHGAGWRWGFGTFAIVVPVVSTPLIVLFAWNYKKAVKAGLVASQPRARTALEAFKYYAIEFDLPGILLLAAGLALFLLPFSLYSYQGNGWRSSMIICMIIFGGLLLIVFSLYEKLFAPKIFVPFSLLTDRTVVGSCVLAGTLFVSFYCWDAYFTSYLQVVHRQYITHATYIGNIYTMGSCSWAFVVGLAIKYSGRFKWLALYLGVPLTILGVGLMIHFRQPDTPLGYVIMCQIFIAFGGGTNVICQQIAVMAASKHENIATVLAIQYMFTQIGGAIGSTVSAAIWTGTFPKALAKYLPADQQANLLKIEGDLKTQLSYPWGSPTRNGINEAYGVGQRYMLIAATSVLVVAVAATAAWRDIRVKDFKQTKGLVI